MKKLVTTSLFIFWAVVTAILVAGLLFYENNKSANNNLNLQGSLLGSGNNNVVGNGSPEIKFTLNKDEVAKHSFVDDCWLIIGGKVYNVSSYIPSHPGGASVIIPYCGKEATQAFNTKGGKGASHSSYANSLLANYYIGDFNQTTSQQTIQRNIQNTSSTQPPAGGDENESEDEAEGER